MADERIYHNQVAEQPVSSLVVLIPAGKVTAARVNDLCIFRHGLLLKKVD